MADSELPSHGRWHRIPALPLDERPGRAGCAYTRSDGHRTAPHLEATKKTVLRSRWPAEEAALLADRVIVMSPRPGRWVSRTTSRYPATACGLQHSSARLTPQHRPAGSGRALSDPRPGEIPAGRYGCRPASGQARLRTWAHGCGSGAHPGTEPPRSLQSRGLERPCAGRPGQLTLSIPVWVDLKSDRPDSTASTYCLLGKRPPLSFRRHWVVTGA